MYSERDLCFSPAEWAAINAHRHFLSQETGREIPIKRVVEDWIENHSQRWREVHEKLKRQTGESCLQEPHFSPAEWDAIRVHRYFLSQRYGRFVALNEATEDWLKNYALIWRAKRTVLSSRNQMKEILRHKWIESEKAGHDLGPEAVSDWIYRYADKWRLWWETE